MELRGICGRGMEVADGDVCVAQVGHDWVVTIEGQSGLALTYGTLRDAFEAGSRAALGTKSRLRLDLSTPRDAATAQSNSELSTAA